MRDRLDVFAKPPESAIRLVLMHPHCRPARFGHALAAFLFVLLSSTARAAEHPPGVWLEQDFSRLPLPRSGYQVYLVGELHGVKEMGDVLLQYLAALQKDAGVRDVALEEDAVYATAAQEYVSGHTSDLPEELCLRAGILRALRELNEARGTADQVRVHLVDVDSPETAIRQHLLSIRGRISAGLSVPIPDGPAVAAEGLAAVDALARQTDAKELHRELRTVARSIGALRAGFRVGTGRSEGTSVYLEDREAAIAEHIRDLVESRGPVIALYGSTHVSKKPRMDGGPARDQEFAPLALRLEQANLEVFSLVVFPLSGRSRWRGSEGELPWTAGDGWLSGGDTLDKVFASVPGAKWLYVDPRRQRVELPSREISGFTADGFLLPATGAPMEYECPRP